VTTIHYDRSTDLTEDDMTGPTVSISAPGDEQSAHGLLPAVPGLRPQSPVPTYVGVALALAGFVLIAVTWGAVAPLKDVAKQLPYIVSGGLTGVGLILVGMTVVSVAARRREAALRERQTEVLTKALDKLSAAIDRLPE
jgi:hypothetical protein